jgi:hypothetical protein
MSFLLPAGLIALVAVPIIILLHMRHTKPRLRPVPTLRFWLAARPEPVEDIRFRRPPITLLLILQLLIAGALALALAQPVTSRALEALGITTRSGPIHLIIILDGSTSMTAAHPTSGTRFEAARALARERLASLREGDVATLLVMGTHQTTQGATDASSLTLLRQRLDTLTPAGGRADLNAALTLAGSLALPDRDDQILLLTDGALSVDTTVAAATGADVELLNVSEQAPAPNVAVVDLAARSDPDDPTLSELYARVMNFAGEELSIPVSLTSDGVEIDRVTVALPPNGGASELVWPLPAGAAQATVRLFHDDALPADNQASVMLRKGTETELALKILLVSDAPAALYRVLTAIPGAQVTVEPTSGVTAALSGPLSDLIVFERFTPSAEQLAAISTPMLFVGPPADGTFPTNGAILQPTLTRLRSHDPLLSGVDLAGVTFGETVRHDLGAGTEVAGTAEGPLIYRTTLNETPAVVFTFDLDRSNLPRRVAFPILVTNAVNELAPSALPSAIALGDPLRYRPRAEAAAVRVTPPEGDPVTLTVASGAGAEQGLPRNDREVSFVNTGQPGRYAITELDGDGNEIGSGQLMVNAGHVRESDLRHNPKLAETLALAHSTDPVTSTRASLFDLWPLLVALGLLLVLVEWFAGLLPRWRPAVYRSLTSTSRR